MITLEDQFEGLFGVPAISVGDQISAQLALVEPTEGVSVGKIVLGLAAIAISVILVVKFVDYIEEQEKLKKM